MKSIDDSFEKRLQAGASLDLKEVMAEPPVREKVDLLQAYLNLFGRRDGIMEHLDAVYAKHYQAYALCLGQARNEWHFDEVLASAEFDSGILLRTMLEISALFNGHGLANGTLEDFYGLGMAGKFADDMIDLVRDIKVGVPNLVYALVQQNTSELSALEAGIQSHARLNSAWWQLHCPASYAQFFEHVSFYASRIVAPHLRLACDLSLIPAVIGRDYDKKN
jgi:hypothetical protein